jgi:hypothetical protein
LVGFVYNFGVKFIEKRNAFRSRVAGCRRQFAVGSSLVAVASLQFAVGSRQSAQLAILNIQ